MIKSEKGTVVFEGRVEKAFSFELTEDRLRKTLDRHMEHLLREIFGTQGGKTCT